MIKKNLHMDIQLEFIKGHSTRLINFVQFCTEQGLDCETVRRNILKELRVGGGLTSEGDYLLGKICTKEELLDIIYPYDYKEPE